MVRTRSDEAKKLQMWSNLYCEHRPRKGAWGLRLVMVGESEERWSDVGFSPRNVSVENYEREITWEWVGGKLFFGENKLSQKYLVWRKKLETGRKSMRYRVFFLTGTPLKVPSGGLHSKTHQKRFKCQNLLTSWHLEFLRGYQWRRKTPCMYPFIHFQVKGSRPVESSLVLYAP